VDLLFVVEFLGVDCGDLRIVVLCIGFVGRFADDGQGGLLRFITAVEDAVEGVVVTARDGVEFVIVAACAGDGEPEQAAADDINAVVIDEQAVVAAVMRSAASW
jgi:hypothetical protein